MRRCCETPRASRKLGSKEAESLLSRNISIILSIILSMQQTDAQCRVTAETAFCLLKQTFPFPLFKCAYSNEKMSEQWCSKFILKQCAHMNQWTYLLIKKNKKQIMISTALVTGPGSIPPCSLAECSGSGWLLVSGHLSSSASGGGYIWSWGSLVGCHPPSSRRTQKH